MRLVYSGGGGAAAFLFVINEMLWKTPVRPSLPHRWQAGYTAIKAGLVQVRGAGTHSHSESGTGTGETPSQATTMTVLVITRRDLSLVKDYTGSCHSSLSASSWKRNEEEFVTDLNDNGKLEKIENRLFFFFPNTFFFEHRAIRSISFIGRFCNKWMELFIPIDTIYL